MQATHGRYLPLIGVVCGILSPCALGNDLLVPSQYATIQAGIDAAIAGDTVLVADGIFTGTGNKDLDFHGKPITVRSASGNPATCVIDCQATGRGFYFHSRETAASVVAGLTIRNGLVTVSGLGGAHGGGVYCLDRSNPTLDNCVIRENTAAPSGNIVSDGGGLSCGANSSPTLTNCTISGNRAHIGGGIICDSGSDPTLTNCTVSGNSITGDGGGMECISSSPRLINCTISENTAVYHGAGIDCEKSSPTLLNCTITANRVFSGEGGAIECDFSSGPMLTNCILWGDTPQEVYVTSGTATVTYSDIQGGYAGTGNLNLDPLFANAGAGNYRLTALSPCIDAGTNTPAGGLPDYDADGNPRVLDGNADGIAVVDMGAYELYRRGACSFAADGSCQYLVPFDCAVAGGVYQGDGIPCGPSSPDPPDAATGVALGADLDWAGAEGAASHDVHFGTISPPPLVANVTSAGWWLPPLASQTTYYWQIVVRGTGETTPGPIWSFTTQAPAPSVPSNPSPWDGAASVSITADLDWADAQHATSYDVYFGMVSPPPAVGTTESSSWPLATLEYETTYYWQIVARNEVGTTAGPLWSFTTAAPYVPGDLNCDGRVDFDDINPFVLAITYRSGYEQKYPDCRWLNGDIDGDGAVNFDDIDPFVTCLVYGGCP